MHTVKQFPNGRSQSVRLPKRLRSEGLTDAHIEHDVERVILSPGKRPSIERLIAALDEFDTFPDRQQPPAPDQRESW